jgi:hypothetical protein
MTFPLSQKNTSFILFHVRKFTIFVAHFQRVVRIQYVEKWITNISSLISTAPLLKLKR